jgi:glycosyltransferase involved in cell wall biosynthesis
MASADVFLFPSPTDTLGNVVLEAQASGLPVVVSDAGGPREMVLDGATGFVAPAHDADGFSDRVVRLLRHVGRRREMGHRARAHAMGRTWPDSLKPLVRTWEAAASRHRLRTTGQAAAAVPLQHSV